MKPGLENTSARALEFDSLRELLGAYASSEPGRAKVAMLGASCDLGWIENQQQLTQEIREFRRAGGSFDFSGLALIGELLENSRVEGAALEALEIRRIIVLIERAEEWRKVSTDPPRPINGWPAVGELSRSIADFRDFLRNFRNKIAADGRLEDRASPELGRIRKEIDRQKRAIQESLRGYLRRLSEGGRTQDELVTIRGERFVIPIKAEHKRKVAGVVHGASSSGQTVFVEPLETIEENNELVRLLEEEQAEVARILLEMTRHIGERSTEIAAAADVLAEVELQFVKARFAEEYQGVRPLFLPDTGPRRALILSQARHPLLERYSKMKQPRAGGRAPGREAVVPISIELEGQRSELIITGPNTGGKTVALKTVGLLALMAQAGVPVPASRFETMAFDAVLADIGDSQSIEQNLSTFSAHITNLDFISRTASAQSLVLLDELGSATDPEEGAALAVAIAEHLAAIGCFTIISTHHTSLKVFGANSPRAVNAAVGFDHATLKPTYELRLGIPGASAGINIAQRLGLNPTIVESARSRLTTQARELGEFLDRLDRELGELERERMRLGEKQAELERAQAQLLTEGKREQQRQAGELQNKLESLLRDFQQRAHEALQQIEDRARAQRLSKDAERRVSKLRREFTEQLDTALAAHGGGIEESDARRQPQPLRPIAEGDWVKLKTVGRNAKVTRRLDDDHFEVAVGAMKMKIARDDVAELVSSAAETPLQAARNRGISVVLENPSEETASELNVIGFTVDDATREVERFVDRAFLAGLPRVRIVHGSGMGILRKALRQFLGQHPHVQSVSEPPQNEGGAGATVAELRV